MTLQVAQSDLQCIACAGQCAFSPVDQMLTCTSCGTAHQIIHPDDADPAQELHYHPDLAHTEQMEITRTRTHVCETCGGAVTFTGATLSEACAYCDGPVVLKAEEASYQTLGLIPFRLLDNDAQIRAVNWAKDRFAAPNDLHATVTQGRVAGIYAPFWTFDSHEAINYMLTYRYKSGKHWHTRTIRDKMQTSFDDMLMPASPHVTPLIRDGILHSFDPDHLRPYNPAYLAGFAAERHHQSVTEGLAANGPDKDLLIRNRIKTHARKTNVRSISYKTHTTGIRYRRVLLPIWILHYRYAGKPMKIVVCGIQGRTFGERPFSYRKLAGYAAAAAVALIGFGWAWGAAAVVAT